MRKILSVMIFVFIFMFVIGCNKNTTKKEYVSTEETLKRKTDRRNYNECDYTYSNIVAIDNLGRVVISGSNRNDNHVGVFYHTWHGVHETKGQVLDLTKILKDNPDYLSSDYLDENANAFHYWGEPLYGYYCSSDPWVVTRHIELMMAMGVDYFVYDYTNAYSYDKEADLIFETLTKFKNQGFDVPKVTFYTNTGSANLIYYLYNKYYQPGLYEDLWYKPNGKPMIIGVSEMTVTSTSKENYLDIVTNFFDFRESQWPDGKTTVENLENGFPWMSWEYPQKNYNGMMSVSLSQHPSAKMSNGELSNYGRGFDFTKFRNKSSNVMAGTNYQGQWETVFKNNENSDNTYVNEVLLTGFNEWMAMKLNDGDSSFFVDTFSMEYSRDIEMMKGGYNDNYVIQTLINTRSFRYDEATHYKYNKMTIDISDFTNHPWTNSTSIYRDLVGDAIERNYRDAFTTTTYIDNSNRNDISKVYVSHDANNLYVAVECDKNITEYNGTDKNWMNLFISTNMNNENSFGGFNYVINRSPKKNNKTTLEISTGGYNFNLVDEIDYYLSGNTITFKIPLNLIGLNENNCYVWVKATDNVTKYDDIMDYYVSGDSAPIGRFAFSYGY